MKGKVSFIEVFFFALMLAILVGVGYWCHICLKHTETKVSHYFELLDRR